MRLCILLAVVCSAAAGAREFVVDYGSNSFSKDGKPFQIISGSIHYFNVPEELWEDRLLSMKNCGVNTLQTYAEWRGIEPQNGVFDFSGRNNITRFIEIAHKLGLLVNLRPGPFIDSEREFGGLPWWLMQVNPNMKLRTNDPEYMKFLTRYWEKLLTQIRPLLYSNGGPIILVQIENEYGSYPACDFTYTGALRDMAISLLGKDVVLYSTDGNNDPFLKCGKNEGVYTTVDFGTQHDVKTSFETQRRHQLRGPSVNSEFYVGWFDHWGRVHQKISNDAVVRSLDQMLSMNASANIYMFHGGTHFGFDNAAKLDPNYKPVLTSYDFDSPLNEAGDPTDKYFAIKNVIRKYAPVPADNPVPKPKAALGDVVLGMKSDLKTVLNVLKSRGKASMSTNPLSFESLSHGYGLVAYETTVSFRPFSPALLKVPGLRDRGYVYVDHELKGILSREIDSYEMPLQIRENQTLTIVVENQGRVGFGAGIMDPKGILEPVQLGNHTLTNWWNTPLPQSDDRNDSFSWSLFDQDVQPEKREQNNTTGLIGLRAYGGTFQIANQTHGVVDTFLNTAGWGKGFVFINGVNIGRYWPSQGPQITLYVPAPYLRLGQNNITVVEQEAAPASLKLSFVDKPLIDEAVPQ